MTHTFRDLDGALVDPSTVRVEVLTVADNVITTNDYGEPGTALIRDSTGVYHIDVDTADISGAYRWRFSSTGTGAGANQGEFFVARDYTLDAGDADPIDPTLRAQLADDAGANMVGFLNTGAGAVARTMQSVLREVKRAADYAGADAGEKINAAILACNSAGGTVDASNLGSVAAAGTITLNKPIRLLLHGTTLDLQSSPGITITADGCSVEGSEYSTFLVTSHATANIVQIGAALSKLDGLTFRSSVARTGGAGVNLRSGGTGTLNRLRFERTYDGVRFGSPATGGMRCSNLTFGKGGSTSGNWRSAMWIGAGTSDYPADEQRTVSSNYFANVSITGDAAFSKAMIVIDGGVDTLHFTNLDAACDQTGSTDSDGVVFQNTATGLTPDNPRWVRFINSAVEAGVTKTGVLLTAGKDIRFGNSYIASSMNAINCNAAGSALSGFSFRNGTIVNIQQNGVVIQGGSDVTISDNRIADCGVATDNTYGSVVVAANINDFRIDNNSFASLFTTANKPQYNIIVFAGTSTRYSIQGNNCPSADFGLGDISNLATGTNVLNPIIQFIATETGGNNAIAGSAAPALVAGLVVMVKLAHTLQAGANTFNYNGSGAVAIKSHLNPANNIGTAYASGGIVRLAYDGTVWQDTSQ